MTFNQDQAYWANFYAKENVFIIQTYSGLGLTCIDHLCPPYILPRDTDNVTLGTTVLQALANSRTFIYDTPEDQDFFDLSKRQQRYDDWILYLCERLGYQTKRALFKKMLNCGIYLNNRQIEISPSRHVKLEAWDGMKDVEHVFLTLDNTSEEIGSGLRLALSRCR
ncbi:contact-dependent growth inhibition system immunity protein [Conchiformibius steedae]|uniref:DUF1436 family protein n=1 Tax=Conchiformibius steedae TaxID=153493 RepID=A0A3P2A2K5_9NEIS|nr:contact-dependent growth inhibition system immunity protein [Conchiformibius steedae]RRD89205.1 DUF1436 family protein [Conchiformibius steedae]